jgi:hypothetical protein
MFIKPLDLTTLPAQTWQNKAGNTHFILQKKESSFGSFFSNITNVTMSAYKKSISDYEFRIILNLHTRKQSFVVAVDESFEKIHKDWNWVELKVTLFD